MDEFLKNFVPGVSICDIEVVHKVEERSILSALDWAVYMKPKGLVEDLGDFDLGTDRFIEQDDEHYQRSSEDKLKKDSRHTRGPAIALGGIHKLNFPEENINEKDILCF